MIYIGKVVTGMLTLLLIVSIITNASAATIEELTEQILSCRQIKEIAHQMAECARFLGFREDHVIIRAAKDKWTEAWEQERSCIAELNKTRKEKTLPATTWTGPVLTRDDFTGIIGPSGKETYYDYPMEIAIRNMRTMGYSEEEYPYWIRSDGAKMLGPYIMCAANMSIRPRGTIVESSLGYCIVVDWCGMAKDNPTWIDIATNWYGKD